MKPLFILSVLLVLCITAFNIGYDHGVELTLKELENLKNFKYINEYLEEK